MFPLAYIVCILYLFAPLPLPLLVLHPELLMSYCPLVERLGFDENFMDVTKMVERRLAETPESNNFSFKGHVYNHLSESHFVVCSCTSMYILYIWLIETRK